MSNRTWVECPVQLTTHSFFALLPTSSGQSICSPARKKASALRNFSGPFQKWATDSHQIWDVGMGSQIRNHHVQWYLYLCKDVWEAIGLQVWPSQARMCGSSHNSSDQPLGWSVFLPGDLLPGAPCFRAMSLEKLSLQLIFPGLMWTSPVCW